MRKTSAIGIWVVFVGLTVFLLAGGTYVSGPVLLLLSALALAAGVLAFFMSAWVGRCAAVLAVGAILYFRGFEIFAFSSWLTRGFAP